jgi:hypothetical protein
MNLVIAIFTAIRLKKDEINGYWIKHVFHQSLMDAMSGD